MSGPYLNTGPFKTKITANDTTQQEELGVWRFEAGKVLRYVKASALIPAGEALKMDSSVTTAALMGMQVQASSGATDMFFGIAETTLAALNFGWVTIYGPATGRVVTADAAGAGLGPSANTGVLSIRNTSHFNAAAIAIQTGLSAGSAVFVSVL